MRKAFFTVALVLITFFSTLAFAADKAPSFCLKNLAGRNFCLDEFPGDVRVLVFWASWCQPCKPLMTFMNQLYQDKWKQGLTVFAINEDGAENRNHTKSTVTQLGIKYPCLLDPDQTTLKTYNPKISLPYLVIIDKSGNIKYHRASYDSSMEESLKKIIDGLLEEPAP